MRYLGDQWIEGMAYGIWHTTVLSQIWVAAVQSINGTIVGIIFDHGHVFVQSGHTTQVRVSTKRNGNV